MKYNPISRRHFLQGMGSMTLGIPLLTSLLPSAAQAQATQAPLRYVQMFSHFGRTISEWYPRTDAATAVSTPYHTIYTTKLSTISGNMSGAMGSSLDPFRNKMSILRGLDALTLFQPNGISFDKHNVSVISTGSLFSDPKLVYEMRNYLPTDVSLAMRSAYSADAVMEELPRFANGTNKSSLRIFPINNGQFGSAADAGSFSFTSRSGTAQHLPYEHDLTSIYNGLFKANTAPVNRLGLRKAATDLALEDYNRAMNGRRISSDDKVRLDNFFSLLSDVSRRLVVGPTLACDGNAPPAASFANAEELHRAAIKMMAAALACGSTRVISYVNAHFGSALTRFQQDEDYHTASHRNYPLHTNGASWMMDRYAELLKELDSIPDTNGTLLDNTLVWYGGEDSTGSHVGTDMPVVIAGATSKLNQGYYVDYRPRPFFEADRRRFTSEDNCNTGDGCVWPDHGMPLGMPLNTWLVTALQTMGVTPSEYQKFNGKTGFGTYDYIGNQAMTNYYTNMITSSARNTPLPFIWKG